MAISFLYKHRKKDDLYIVLSCVIQCIYKPMLFQTTPQRGLKGLNLMFTSEALRL